MLFTAFGIACHEGLAADIKLVCTGTLFSQRNWLVDAISSLGLTDRVIFPGYLQDKELSVLLKNSGGVIFPSLYEGFGLPIIEAMSVGVPVACSNTTSLPEVAAEAAIFFDPRIPTQIAQVMISLMDNEALRTRLILAGLQRAVEFLDWERMTLEYLEIFQEAVDFIKYENKIDGVYADSWVGTSLGIDVVPVIGSQVVEIEFFAPSWLPQSRIVVQGMHLGRKLGAPCIIVRGTTVVWSMPVGSKGGHYNVMVGPTFVPEHYGYGNVQRKLSVMLKRCDIICADGKCIELFRDKVLK
jgi:hypothetical protein